MPFELDAEFWVAVAFVIFFAVLAKFGVHRLLLGALDGRNARITAEVGEARRVRDEARALLAEYQRRRKDADQEAEAIIAAAKAEAERHAADAKSKVEEFVARRIKIAETKIAQAEAQAFTDVRVAAAEAAVAVAEKILTETTKGTVSDTLITQGVRNLKLVHTARDKNV